MEAFDNAIDEVKLICFHLSNAFELAGADPNKYLPAVKTEKHLGKEVNV